MTLRILQTTRLNRRLFVRGLQQCQQPFIFCEAQRQHHELQQWTTPPLSTSTILMGNGRRDYHHQQYRSLASKAKKSSSDPDCPIRIGMDPEQRKKYYEAGIVDERGLVIFDTLHDMQVRACQIFASKNLFSTYSEEAKNFEWMTYQQYADNVAKCRTVLKDLGVEQYSKVGIISNNRWEWAAIAAASYSLNANVVPMYEAQLAADWTYILNDSGAVVLFVANDEILKLVRREVLPNTPGLKAALSLDAHAGQAHALKTAMAAAQPDTDGKLITVPSADDLANLIYTSGTTGKPKGVELTHMNFTSNVKSAARTMVLEPHDFIKYDDVSLAFLPWAHSYGQTCELWMGMSHGASMGISRGIPRILEDLQLVKPTVLFSVPTLYKKIYDGVHNMIEASPPIKKRLMKRALHLGHEHSEASMHHRPPLGILERLQYKLLDRIILAKIRDRFGGRLRHGFVAGAATPTEVLQFMDSIGIPVCEGYGLTETSPIITINTPEQRQVGSVGRPIGGVTVYIIDENGNEVPRGTEGEICCIGPNVMRGYYKNPEATAEVITISPDGVSPMFHTGDLGRQGEDSFVKVTGRLKEQYKLENGKYVVPTPIEEAIGMSRFIAQVVLTGANRPYNVALLVPEWTAIRSELKIDANVAEADIIADERLSKLIDSEVASMCSRLKKYEVPQKWAFVEPFTAANFMLTPKMSIRRHKVMTHYADVIDSLYGEAKVVADSADAKGHIAEKKAA